ncbi:MAG TPA: hypothetical protein VN772_02345 [Solirubrobacteraceae bacterium]|nr:hypothetical protein [Solirubrobacteraceae bacterium]
MRRLSLPLLLAAALLLVSASAAGARGASRQTLRLRAQVPNTGDLSVLSFELSIGGEGRAHRRQPVSLEVRNQHLTGVFAIARLHPVPHHPGRFLGVLEVFHRAGGATASLPFSPGGWRSPLPSGARASGPAWDEFLVRAHNEHIIKEALKDNIVALAGAHGLGPLDFCDPLSPETYLLGNAVILSSVLLAQPLTILPTNTSIVQLADDAVYELCDDIEDEEEGEEDEPAWPGIATLNSFLGVAPPPSSSYRVSFAGGWVFEGPNEVKLMSAFSGGWVGPGAGSSDSTNPIDAIKVVLPPAGSTPRTVTNDICPAQLPTATIATTNTANDTLMCSGGSLPLGAQFTLNVQTQPVPSSGMGGQLLAHQDGSYLAPFPITGP